MLRRQAFSGAFEAGKPAVRKGYGMRVLQPYSPAKLPADRQLELISVIIPAYNIEDYIQKSLRSVLGQTYRHLEIIVVDDGSTDATGQICDRMASEDARIQVIHKANGGLADARNAGIAAATGAYIGFVDGDDWIDADMYEKLLGALQEQQADLAICRSRCVYKTHTTDGSVDRAVIFEGQEALEHQVKETAAYRIQNAAWNKLYKRELLEGISFPVGKWYEDIVFSTEVLDRAKRSVYLDTACYNYIIDREGSIMNTNVNRRTFTDQIPAYYEKAGLLRKMGRDDLADIHDYFFCKRLLQFYRIVERSQSPDREEFMARLTEMIRDNAAHFRQVCTCSEAKPRDGRRLRLFLKSPARYSRFVTWEETVVIPLKAKVKGILKK